ncbi:hypothetical protein WN943_025144 [Citrus x changshan-huyou]
MWDQNLYQVEFAYNLPDLVRKSGKEEDFIEQLQKIHETTQESQLLPSHIRTADVFNVKHLIPYRGDHDEDVVAGNPNSRVNSLHPGENDEEDGTVRVWDCESGQCVKIINNGAEIGCLICEGSWVFIGLPNAVKAWRVNTANNDCDEAFVLDGPIGQVNALVVYNDLLFAGSEDGAIRVWNVEDLECVQTLCGGHSDAVMSLLFWDEYLFSCSLDKTIKI